MLSHRTLLAGFLITLVLSFGAFASTVLTCKNNATQAQITVQQENEYVLQTFVMNDALMNALKNQGGHYVPSSGEVTQYSVNNGIISLYAAISGGYSLSLGSDSGGVKLYYIAYDDFQYHRNPVTFYFNPGECRLN